jgi:uncharacterized integral membrane protein
MKIFVWLAFLVVVVIAIFGVQNSTASTVVMRFLLWRFETSLVYAILGSIGSGILLCLLLLLPVTIRVSLRSRSLRKDAEASNREAGAATGGKGRSDLR